jgi:hypothetical protein
VAVKVCESVAHFAGLALCGSIHACPSCGAKIREGRADEIRKGGLRWLEMGGRLVFVTMTMPHDYGDRLVDTWDTVSEGWRYVFSNAAGARLARRFGIPNGLTPAGRARWMLGKIASREVTFGVNGWHPHLHALLFVRPGFSAADLVELQATITARWNRYVVSRGFREPGPGVGVVCELGRSAGDLGQYLSKASEVDTSASWGIGRELTRADLKQAGEHGMTPWQLLAHAQTTGDCSSLALWNEYELATFGRSAITWSQGLRSLLEVAEVDDQELAEAEVGGEVVALIGAPLWKAIRRRRLARSAVLEAVERGGWWAGRDWLQSAGFDVSGWYRPPDVQEGPGGPGPSVALAG